MIHVVVARDMIWINKILLFEQLTVYKREGLYMKRSEINTIIRYMENLVKETGSIYRHFATGLLRSGKAKVMNMMRLETIC